MGRTAVVGVEKVQEEVQHTFLWGAGAQHVSGGEVGAKSLEPVGEKVLYPSRGGRPRATNLVIRMSGIIVLKAEL